MALDRIRRVVTGHDSAGTAIVIDDGPLEATVNPSGASEVTVVWATATSPVDNNDPTDGRDRAPGLTMPGGSVIRILDLLPGKSVEMHRTDSLDYGIVMSGAIEVVLDDDAVTTLSAGDVIVQRGTIHGWRNSSADTIARVAFVLLDAMPASIDGVALPAIRPGDKLPER